MMRMVVVAVRRQWQPLAAVIGAAASGTSGVDNWSGSLWRQWRRQALAPVCVFALSSSARGRLLVVDFGFYYAHGPWKIVKKRTE